MNITHLSKYDKLGGAAIAAFRLHMALNKAGAQSAMVVDMKTCDDPSVHGPESLKGMFAARNSGHLDRLPLKFYARKEPLFHPAWARRRMNFPLLKNSDIINLHWTTGGFMSIGNIASLAKLGKPVVWTLHDMWAFTGGCHYAGECGKYKAACGACPQLGSSRAGDLSAKVFRRKKRAYADLNLHIVTPSGWLGNRVKDSALLSGRPVQIIPNGLDTGVFKPAEKNTARSVFNFPEDKKIILFGAAGGTSDKRKGFRYLFEAINRLKEIASGQKDYMLLIFGAGHSKGNERFPFETVFAGALSDEVSMSVLYSCADVFVLPSLGDNLPNTIMESMACGTPVAAFDVGGVPDMVEHMKNGFLAKYMDSEDLAQGIKWVLEDERRRQALGEAAREKALEDYSMDVLAKSYLTLYESITSDRPNRKV